MQLKIRDLKGNVEEITIPDNTSNVATLRNFISKNREEQRQQNFQQTEEGEKQKEEKGEEKAGETHKLVFNGVVLSDDKTLSSYNITDGGFKPNFSFVFFFLCQK